ncbi:hypothetical protein LSAT2_000220 [Lamellibrachia satsuma]|nr:hypothetical protein LSAT2_000220 [Lamellibrachia satsuma]
MAAAGSRYTCCPSQPLLTFINERKVPMFDCDWLCVSVPARAIFENDPVKSPADSPSTDDNSLTEKHKEALPQEATDGDASNDSDVIIIGEETAPLRESGATPRGVDSPSGAGKPVSEDLLMKVRAMLKASRQEIDMT